jgi:hypothetical protein
MRIAPSGLTCVGKTERAAYASGRRCCRCRRCRGHGAFTSANAARQAAVPNAGGGDRPRRHSSGGCRIAETAAALVIAAVA